MGSDFPHAEGLVAPLDYANELAGCSAPVVRQVMRENGRALSQRLN